MYSPGWARQVPPMVSPFTRGIGPAAEDVGGAVPSSAAYESAGRAVYIPILLPAPCVAKRVWWANGATTTGGATISVGIYANSGYGPGALLVSGSATQGTASEVQFVDITDTTLTPGLYWLALCCSASTNTTIMRNITADMGWATSYRFDEDASGTLPATATPVETRSYEMYLFGFATTSSP